MKGDELDSVPPMWADEEIATAYAAWHPVAVTFFRPTIDALIAAGEVRPGMRVLDIGTGTGIPALAVAGAVGPKGHVVASDPSSAMLAAAQRNASPAGLGYVSFTRAVAESLPFPDDARLFG
jgi:ubiquinone/menaquinone biosynthesis C-methylase UbiE